MPRVLHVIPYLDASAGGPPAVVSCLAKHAAESGWDARIVTSQDYTSDNGARLRKETDATVLTSQFAALFKKERDILNEAVATAELLHCHTMWSPLVAAAASTARRRNIPYVLSPHGMLDPYSVGQKSLRKRVYLAFIESRTINGAARMMFTTQAEMDLANQTIAKLPEGNVTALGADPLPIKRGMLRTDFFRSYPDLLGRRILIFLGRLHEKKRPEAAIQALVSIRHEIPDVVLLLAGSGDTKFVQNLESLAEKLRVRSSVRFLGHKSGNEKWQALAASDLFVLPSQQENFAIAAAEALQAGAPVLLTRQVNIWEDVIKANAGIVIEDRDVVSGLSTAAISLLKEPERLDIMSKQAMSLAANTYNWALCSRKTIDVYENVLTALR